MKLNTQYSIPNTQYAFTFIELLITLAIIAICFLPLMHMFSAGIEQAYVTSDLTTARYLAQESMEKLKNLGFTESQLEKVGDVLEPPLDSPPLEVNGKKWRILRKIIHASDPLEVHIQVYQEKAQTPIVELATLIEDLDWKSVE